MTANPALNKEKCDVPGFVDHFQVCLSDAYQRLCVLIRKSTGRSVEVVQSALHLHTFDVVTRGHEKYGTAVDSFSAYVDSVRLDHIKWVAAVLKNDEAAATAFVTIIRTKVSPAIMAKFDHREFAARATEDLPSRIFMEGKSRRPRIAEYLGRSSLETWLVGIGYRLAINERRRPGQAPGGDVDVFADTAAGNTSTQDQIDQIETIRNTLLAKSVDAVRKMNSQEQLVFQMTVIKRLKPAQVAEYLSVSRARVSQIRQQIKQKIITGAEDFVSDIVERYGASRESVENLLWKILDELESNPSDSAAQHSGNE